MPAYASKAFTTVDPPPEFPTVHAPSMRVIPTDIGVANSSTGYIVWSSGRSDAVSADADASDSPVHCGVLSRTVSDTSDTTFTATAYDTRASDAEGVADADNTGAAGDLEVLCMYPPQYETFHASESFDVTFGLPVAVTGDIYVAQLGGTATLSGGGSTSLSDEAYGKVAGLSLALPDANTDFATCVLGIYGTVWSDTFSRYDWVVDQVTIGVRRAYLDVSASVTSTDDTLGPDSVIRTIDATLTAYDRTGAVDTDYAKQCYVNCMGHYDAPSWHDKYTFEIQGYCSEATYNESTATAVTGGGNDYTLPASVWASGQCSVRFLVTRTTDAYDNDTGGYVRVHAEEATWA